MQANAAQQLFPSIDSAGPAVPPADSVYSVSRDLRDGDAGIAQTIAVVRQAVWKSLSDPWMRAQVGVLVRGLPAYDNLAVAQKFWRSVYQGVRWTDHPVAHQLVQEPRFTVESGIGNCTDINAVLLSALLMNVGIPVHVVTIANNPHHPDEFNHVIVEAEIDGEWIPIDAARPDATFGTTVPNIYRSRVWELLSRDYYERPRLQGAYLGDDTSGDIPTDTIGPMEGPPAPGFPGGPGWGGAIPPDGWTIDTSTTGTSTYQTPNNFSSILNSITNVFGSIVRGIGVAGRGGPTPIVSPGGSAPASGSSGMGTLLLFGALGLGTAALFSRGKK